MVLTSENNTYCNTGVDYKDGHASRQFVKIGETNFVIITPEKFVYHPEIEKCRDRPFNQLLAEKIVKAYVSELHVSLRKQGRVLQA